MSEEFTAARLEELQRKHKSPSGLSTLKLLKWKLYFIGNLNLLRIMMILHKKAFGIYHWDTFDNETLLVGEADSLLEAIGFVLGRYHNRISKKGADRVDIVDSKGNVVEKYNVT